MNISKITTTNSKGQVVIPKSIRDKLGINQDVSLQIQIQGQGVYISLLNMDLVSQNNQDLELQILESTVGAWADKAGWEEDKNEDTHQLAQKQSLELAASAARKQAW